MPHADTRTDAIEHRLARLERRNRWLASTTGVLGCALLATLTMGARAPAQQVLDVERINIVEADGSVRLVISNAARFPLPVLGGQTLKRAVQPAGLVFYDRKGDEVGGLALTDVDAGRVSALAFDYPNYDAVGLVTRTDAQNRVAMAGLQINSHPPAGLTVQDAAKVVRPRIQIQNENEDAQVLLSDPQGRPRIRLGVDHDGVARFEMLDGDGRVTFSAPAQGH